MQYKPNYNIVDHKNNAGFTIVEVLVVVSIFSFLIFMVTTMIVNIFVGSRQQFAAIDNVDRAKLVATSFVNEMRNAVVGADGSYQLNTASDNQIIFYSKSSAVGATINRINYYILANKLYKGITIPSGSPQTYNLASEVKTLILPDVVNAQGVPVFTYYDGNYDANASTSAIVQPVNVNLVKFVKINLSVLKQIQALSTANFTISAGATIRNVKNNL